MSAWNLTTVGRLVGRWASIALRFGNYPGCRHGRAPQITTFLPGCPRGSTVASRKELCVRSPLGHAFTGVALVVEVPVAWVALSDRPFA
jgi:hypothetical protein